MPLAVPDALGGGNKALKSLLEVEGFAYPKRSDVEAVSTPARGRIRQEQFQEALAQLAAGLPDDEPIPFAFRDARQLPWRLDSKAVGMARAARVIGEVVADTRGRVVGIRLSADFQRTRVDAARRALAAAVTTEASSPHGDLSSGAPTAVSDSAVRPPDPYAELDLDAIPGETFAAAVRCQRIREDQARFRARLLSAYARCAVTRISLPEALEAAHIIPDELCGSRGFDVRNGILLKADLHRLFDAALLGFSMDGDRLCVRISPVLTGTPYAKYDGKEVVVPTDPAQRPSPAALRIRAEKFPLKQR